LKPCIAVNRPRLRSRQVHFQKYRPSSRSIRHRPFHKPEEQSMQSLLGKPCTCFNTEPKNAWNSALPLRRGRRPLPQASGAPISFLPLVFDTPHSTSRKSAVC
jgi:hypothetical protein